MNRFTPLRQKVITAAFLVNMMMLQIILAGCHRQPVHNPIGQQPLTHYGSGIPEESELEMLNTIGLSVKKISCYAEYTTWVFARHSGMRPGSDFSSLSARAVRVMRTPESVLGTATILSYSTDKVLAVTCAHVIGFPDTLYTYHESDITGEQLIYTASIKKSQINYVKEIPVAGGLKILAIDETADLALLGGTLSAELETPPALPVKIGKSQLLECTNRAWSIGFPIGYRMVTEALVNNPGFDNRGGFMLDAVFNPGYSGGLTLAFNLISRKFEVVGFGRSAPSSPQFILTPSGTPGLDRYPPQEPYTDKVFVQQRAELAHGLTFVSPSEALIKLLQKHRQTLIHEGYDLSFLE